MHDSYMALNPQLSGELIVSKYVAESEWFCYVFAHDQFARYQQSSNEPLRYQIHN